MTGALLDRRTGLLVDTERLPVPPGMPSCWVSYGAAVGRTDRFAGWRADSYGFGAALGLEAAAAGAAVGEAVERYCGNAIPAGLPVASHAQLWDAGRDAVEPRTFALFSARQHALPGFPFTRFTDDLRIAWVQGSDLHTGAPCMVPASMAYLDYHHGPRRAEPATHPLVYSGIAAGRDVRSARRSALEELLERDATTIWWSGGGPSVALDDDGLVTGQLGRPDPDHPLTVRLFLVPNQFGVPVVAAFVEDDAGDVSGFGSACRADPRAAAAKALVEALGVLRLARDLGDPGSTVWTAVSSGQVERHVYLPHRADRRHLDDAGEAFRNLTDLPAVAQLYLDPRMRGAPLDRLRRADRTVPLADVPAVAGADPVPAYLHRLAGAGLRAVSVDLTTPDVAAAGWHVVRVVVPGLVGNAPPAFPYRGGRRLFDLPARLGWTDRPLTEDDLVPHPIPLA